MEDNLIDIDFDFIDILFFSNPNSKKELLNKIEKELQRININGNISREKLFKEINSENFEWKVLAELFVFKFDRLIGKEKIENYYTALNVCRHNFREKIKDNVNDFTFELELLQKALKFRKYNYALIETLYLFGKEFHTLKNFEKRDFYFEIIFKNKFEISQNTVSQYFKKIGILYYENECHSAKKWFEKGVELNPNLNVKQLINKCN